MTHNQQTWQQQALDLTEHILNSMLPENHHIPKDLHQAMRYSCLDGGKRLRPLLVFAASKLGQTCVTAARDNAMAAVECIHVYSLVHDDMPIMDNDNLRRGKPTCHIQYGEALALLTGDALQTLAFERLSLPTDLPSQRQLRMINILAHSSGSLGMAGGQAIDLAHIGKNMSQIELEQMHSLKTGALIRASVLLGGLSCSDIDDNALIHLDHFAKHLGLAFQVIDDVLDYEADTQTLGKTAGKDQQANKPTYVKLMGLSQARTYAETLIHDAIYQLTIFEDKAKFLQELALYVVQRKH